MWKTWGIVDVSSPIVDTVVIHLCGAENGGTINIRAAPDGRLLSVIGACINTQGILSTTYYRRSLLVLILPLVYVLFVTWLR